MKKLYLSNTDKKLAGICGCLGELLDFDPTIIRLIFVFATLATGLFPMLIVYLVGWIIIPQTPVGELAASNSTE